MQIINPFRFGGTLDLLFTSTMPPEVTVNSTYGGWAETLVR